LQFRAVRRNNPRHGWNAWVFARKEHHSRLRRETALDCRIKSGEVCAGASFAQNYFVLPATSVAAANQETPRK
jgi:hypothetical protein